MVVKSKLNTSINRYFRTVDNIEIHRGYGKDIIVIKSGLKNICIDTERSVTSKTINGLKKAERKTVIGKSGSERDRVYISSGSGGNSMLLGAVIGIADYIDKNNIEVFEGNEGYEVNHKDYSGNISVRGFGNNHIYNLEFVPEGLNSVHNLVEQSLYRIFGEYFGISALDEELMNKVRFGEDHEVVDYFESIKDTTEIDVYGTKFIGKAGLELREYKKNYPACF